jgi:hypothetical protein
MLKGVSNHIPFHQKVFFFLFLLLTVELVIVLVDLGPLISFNITWNRFDVFGASGVHALHILIRELLLSKLVDSDSCKVFVFHQFFIFLSVEEINCLPFQEITVSGSVLLLLV